MTAKRSYSYSDYWIEVTVQEAGGHFQGIATIFVPRESALRGGGFIHRMLSEGVTENEADKAAAARAEAWADGPGAAR